jgi:hypothetical protein
MIKKILKKLGYLIFYLKINLFDPWQRAGQIAFIYIYIYIYIMYFIVLVFLAMCIIKILFNIFYYFFMNCFNN